MRPEFIERGRRLANSPKGIEARLSDDVTVNGVLRDVHDIVDLPLVRTGQGDYERDYGPEDFDLRKPGLNPIVVAWIAAFVAIGAASWIVLSL